MRKLIVCCLLIAAVCAVPAQPAILKKESTDDGTPSIWSRLLVALTKFAKDRDWEELLSNILKGKFKDLWNEYKGTKEQRKGAFEFIKENGTDIVLAVFRAFGAEGDDLASILASILQGPLEKLLGLFFKSLSGENAKAVARIFTGIVKLTVKLVKNPQEKWSALSNFLSDDIVAVVKVFLPSVFDNSIVKGWLGKQ